MKENGLFSIYEGQINYSIKVLSYEATSGNDIMPCTDFQAGPTFPNFPFFFDLLLLFPTFSLKYPTFYSKSHLCVTIQIFFLAEDSSTRLDFINYLMYFFSEHAAKHLIF